MSMIDPSRRRFINQMMLARGVGRATRQLIDRYVAGDKDPPPQAARSQSQKPRKKPASKQKKEVGKLKKKVTHLQQMEDNTSGTMTYRELYSGAILSAINHHKVYVAGAVSTTAYETVLAQCRFFDPSNPGSLLVGSQAAGTYSRKSLIKSVSNKLDFRNNYLTPAHVTVYHCICKADTDNGPNTLWNNGIAKQAEGNLITTNSDIGQYPTDYDGVTDAWKLKVAFKGELQPGESASVVNSVNDVIYSSSTVDGQNMLYERDIKSQCYMIVVRGCLSHAQATPDQVTYQSGGIDYFGTVVFKVQYNAGMNLRYIYVQADNAPSFTTTPVCSNKPLASNQTYSQA